MEELAALAVRHAQSVEAVIDDALDLFKTHSMWRAQAHVQTPSRAQARTRSQTHAQAHVQTQNEHHSQNELAPHIRELIDVASTLISNHFRNTLTAKVSAHITRDVYRDNTPSSAYTIAVYAKQINQRIDPLEVYAHADAYTYAETGMERNLWMCTSTGFSIVTLGVLEAIEPRGADRFSIASTARAMLEARVQRYGATDAPVPVLLGGFAFRHSTQDTHSVHNAAAHNQPHNTSNSSMKDCRLLMGELTVLNKPEGYTWILAAEHVAPEKHETEVVAELEHRIDTFAADFADFPADFLADIGQHQPHAHQPHAKVKRHHTHAHKRDRHNKNAQHLTHDGDYTKHDDDYIKLVQTGIERITEGDLQKVVLARYLDIPVDITSNSSMVHVLLKLLENNPDCVMFAFTHQERTFFGATPEELATFDKSDIHTTALAGTVKRGDSVDEDERLAHELFTSDKYQSEHAFVVEGILAALAKLGLSNPNTGATGLMKLPYIQHLRTQISAQAQSRRTRMNDMDVIRVAGALHPTPAVGGTPNKAALDFIAQNENFSRGWYAAPVGWCDIEGKGEFRVALRSALASANSVRLFAGAGVVTGSKPETELAETYSKLRTLLDAIGSHEYRIT